MRQSKTEPTVTDKIDDSTLHLHYVKAIANSLTCMDESFEISNAAGFHQHTICNLGYANMKHTDDANEMLENAFTSAHKAEQEVQS